MPILKFVPSIDQFVALIVRGRSLEYAFSSDLLKWSEAAPLMQFSQKQRWQEGDQPGIFHQFDDNS